MERFAERFADPLSAVTHIFGVFIAMVGGVTLVFCAISQGNDHLLALTVYAFWGVGMFTGSAVYHTVKCSPETRAFLRKIDHVCIFGFIAATYTPVCVIALKDNGGTGVLLAAWAMAIGGGSLKHFWKKQPKVISYIIYLVAGWLVVLAAPFLPRSLQEAMPKTFTPLLIGGLFYTVGALIDGLGELLGKRYKFHGWGGHEIFHVFVLAGWAVHFYMNWQLI
ncbi:MAG: hypothetical protein A3F54_03285 [Candidatus Kerfeldbacteria bacterium RIFCSPHIGHO2_12_FULL_48_17]|uniref:Hemolysin n=1 Tax=Candidatus Kerfeldbacteria bacterium RIFCSPHIGHO2_12_FULL_48_17 TaxID=1798542 RepID=A0A1G2B6I7_9BACT|nr:MAG: hypothetical protein A3F54_03285 [Candidatus Kerfeldbacteria bacterium RIFCSPHIGHO2_12_FULL_48_17]